jgi:hypothetical protein
MGEKSVWVRRQIQCPEKRGESRLLLEWHIVDGEAALNGISCDNPQLKDLSGNDCEWSCWEQITETKSQN